MLTRNFASIHTLDVSADAVKTWARNRQADLPVAVAIHAIATTERPVDTIWADCSDEDCEHVSNAISEYLTFGDLLDDDGYLFDWGNDVEIEAFPLQSPLSTQVQRHRAGHSDTDHLGRIPPQIFEAVVSGFLRLGADLEEADPGYLPDPAECRKTRAAIDRSCRVYVNLALPLLVHTGVTPAEAGALLRIRYNRKGEEYPFYRGLTLKMRIPLQGNSESYPAPVILLVAEALKDYADRACEELLVM